MATKKPRCLLPILVICAIGVAFVASFFQSRPRNTLLLQAIEQINDDDPTVSTAARATIMEAGTNAVPLLLSRLSQSDTRGFQRVNSVYQSFRKNPSVELLKSAETKRSEAVTAFGVLGEMASPFLPAMFRLLTNANTELGPGASLRIAECIAVTGQSAKPWLVKALVHPDTQVRKASITVIGVHFEGATDLCPDVILALSDPDAEIRELALFFVVTTCSAPEQILPLLRKALQDPDPHVRKHAEKEMTNLENGSKPQDN